MAVLPACASVASNFYHVPLATIERVSTHSAGGRAIGAMGIHPDWLPLLERAGFDTAAVQSDVCMNIAAGAWILAWSGAGSAHATSQAHTSPPLSRPIGAGTRSCAIEAARHYHIPEQLYLALLATEGGQVGKTHRNSNGSYDMGPAQINSINLPDLARMGITREQVINDGCLNVHVGAWILAGKLGGQGPDDPAEFWRRVGNYNSATPVHNHAYQLKVWNNLVALARSQKDGGS